MAYRSCRKGSESFVHVNVTHIVYYIYPSYFGPFRDVVILRTTTAQLLELPKVFHTFTFRNNPSSSESSSTKNINCSGESFTLRVFCLRNFDHC
jgi:hypothetical protein